MVQAVRRRIFSLFAIVLVLLPSLAEAKVKIPSVAAPVFSESYPWQGNPLKAWRADLSDPWSVLDFGAQVRTWLDLETIQAMELDSARLLGQLIACAGSDPARARQLYLHSLSQCPNEPTLQKEIASFHVRFDQFLESSEVHNLLRDPDMTLNRLRDIQFPRINPLFQQVILESLATYGFYRTLDVDYDRGHAVTVPPSPGGRKFKTVLRWTGRTLLAPIETVNPVNVVRPSRDGTGALTEAFDRRLNQSGKVEAEANRSMRSIRIARLLLLTILLSPTESKENWGLWPQATESIFYGLDSTIETWGGGVNGFFSQGSPGSLSSSAYKRAVKQVAPINNDRNQPMPHWNDAHQVVSALRSLSRAYSSIR